MKCLYYLAPNLDSTQGVADDLRDVGVEEWYLHVISHDEAGLKRKRIHSGNLLETTDLVRDGIIGANLGFIGAVLAAGLVMLFEPFGPDTPKAAYFFVILVFTLFGAWVGGLTGIDSENRKVRRFHDELADGQYLALIYAYKEKEKAIRAMMDARHPEARLAAVDRHFLNPFSRLRRRRNPETTPDRHLPA